MRYFAVLLVLAPMLNADLIDDVRSAVAQVNFGAAESAIQRFRSQHGVTPEMLEALSWMARDALQVSRPDKAEAYAHETQSLVEGELKRRPLDSDPHLPIALGAAIEVQAQVLASHNDRNGALELLRKELAAYGSTSLRARIQKNINLLSLEGKPAPPLDEREYLGGKPVPLSALRGKPVLLFFWAHWCVDCKAESAIIAQLRREYAARGLTVLMPTQRYGYAAGGEDTTPPQELKYIDEVRRKFYADLLDVPAPLSEDNFKRYGASTTPTLVLIDRGGVVRLYHPGRMTIGELRAAINSIV